MQERTTVVHEKTDTLFCAAHLDEQELEQSLQVKHCLLQV
jgi:hypothetical protein